MQLTNTYQRYVVMPFHSDWYTHLVYIHYISTDVLSSLPKVSVVILSNLLWILNQTIHSINGDILFSFHFRENDSYQFILTSHIHHCLTCLFLPLNQSMRFFSTVWPKVSAHNCQGSRYVSTNALIQWCHFGGRIYSCPNSDGEMLCFLS